VKSSEAAEPYDVSSENFGSYNTFCPTQNMGSGKLPKRAEAHWKGLGSDSEEEPDCEYTDEEGYLSEGDLDIPEGGATGKKGCETNTDAFQKMMKTEIPIPKGIRAWPNTKTEEDETSQSAKG
jgi:hypothetical protein